MAIQKRKTQAYIQTLESDGGRFQQSYQRQWASQTRYDKVADYNLTAFHCKRHCRTLTCFCLKVKEEIERASVQKRDKDIIYM